MNTLSVYLILSIGGNNMLVLSQKEYIPKKGEETPSEYYTSEFISYNKTKQSFILKLTRHDLTPAKIDRSVVVEMNVREIEAMSDTGHIREAFTFAEKWSEGYRPIPVKLYVYKNNVIDFDIPLTDMEDYIRTTNGFNKEVEHYNPDKVYYYKIYWLTSESVNSAKDNHDIIDMLGGMDYIKNDILSTEFDN